MIKYENLSKEVNEFLLSFNTTMCFGAALFIFLVMREYSHIIKEETIDSIADATSKFIPKPVINLLDKFHRDEDESECLSPV